MKEVKFSHLVAKLVEGGYKGAKSPDAVFSEIADREFDLDGVTFTGRQLKALVTIDTDSNTISVDGSEPMSLDANPETEMDDEEEETKMEEDEEDTKSVRVQSSKSKQRAQEQRSRLFSAQGSIGVPAIRSARGRAIKQYDAAIDHRGRNVKNGGKAFTDGETAEAAGAWLRLAITEAQGIRNYAEKRNDEDIVTKSNLVSDLSQGGALVPGEFSTDIIYNVEQFGAGRRAIGITPMSEATLTLTASGRTTHAGWVSEGSAKTETNLDTTPIQLVAQKLFALTRVSNELLNDSAVSVADRIAIEFAQSMAEVEDNAIFNGDGTTTYGSAVGIIPSFTSIAANPEDAAGLFTAAGNAYSEVTLDDVYGVLGLIPHYGGGAPSILCHRRFYYEVLVRLMGANLVGTSAADAGAAVGGGGAADGMFHGIPVFFAQQMLDAEANDGVPMLAGYFDRGVKFGEVRNSLTIASSEHDRFAYDEVSFRDTNRVAINVHDVGDASNPGPICGLILEDA